MDVEHRGEYEEIERPRRLAYSLAVDGGESSHVIIDIISLPGGCELMLTHEMDPRWAEYADQVEQGWTGILDGLGTTLEEQHSASDT